LLNVVRLTAVYDISTAPVLLLLLHSANMSKPYMADTVDSQVQLVVGKGLCTMLSTHWCITRAHFPPASKPKPKHTVCLLVHEPMRAAHSLVHELFHLLQGLLLWGCAAAAVNRLSQQVQLQGQLLHEVAITLGQLL
jgi:hypothetical protein